MSSFFGPTIVGEPPPERADDLRRLVDRERRLRDVGDGRLRWELERLGLGDVLDEDRRVRRLAHRPDDLLVAGVADQEHRVAGGGVATCLDVHLRDERAGRVDHVVPELLRVRVHGRRDAVRGVDDGRPDGDVALVLDEDRPARLEVAHDVDVVDDLLANVHGRAVVLERLLDRLDRALDARAVAAGGRQENTLDCHA